MLGTFDFSKLKDILSYDSQAPLIFSSGLFFWMFVIFLGIYIMLKRRDNLRLLFVVLFSYYFYYKSSGFYFFLLAVVTCSDFVIASLIHRLEKKSTRKWLLILSLTINLGLLCYFKYTNFLGEAFAAIFGGSFEFKDIFLPVGISFFTFQSMSYTIDVYRRQLQPVDNLLDYAFYVSFFPQLVAGPIVRARDFIPQIRQPLFVSREMFGRAVFLIVMGLIKKAIISDYISVNFVDRIFDNPMLYSGVENLMGVYGYALQIYCDFSGYSDMAIGIALLLGFRFNINFDVPYQSSSITEFWRRWHISLSSWLKDYLYISLGGNRKGKIRQYINLMLTMLLGGLWHGASFNFIVWGGLHGIALVGDKIRMGLFGIGKGYKATGWKRLLGIFITFHFVCLCWIFFRCREFESVKAVLSQIFTSFSPQIFNQLITGYWQVFALMLLGYILHFLPQRVREVAEQYVTNSSMLFKVALLVVVIILVVQAKGSDVQPFIYFQF
ncbi:MAG: MBOAT family protein [Bacteroidales bacterium]|nr:MBOAT family protein [Bacteroidales bacterium]